MFSSQLGLLVNKIITFSFSITCLANTNFYLRMQMFNTIFILWWIHENGHKAVEV